MELTRLLLSATLLPSLACGLSSQLYDTYSFNPLQHLAGIAPYFEPNDPPRDPNPPDGCTVTKAAYLVRHAAINANDFDYETYIEPFLSKLENHTNIDWGDLPSLAFLQTWIPPSFAEQERLTRVGKLEAAQLGVEVSFRYPNFRAPRKVWASTAERTVVSAESFIRGYEASDNNITLVEIYESEEGGANTLTPYDSCPAYSSSAGSEQSQQYLSRWSRPYVTRLNHVFSSFNFTAYDIVGMMELCGYETVIRGSSPFCSLDLFPPDAWLSFEYTNDIMYFYNTGYGQPVSGSIALPWVNATMGLLQSDDDGPSSQDIYVSFTHREFPPTVLVAMGLFNNSDFIGGNPNASMPLDRINYNRAWVSSYILPFLTNIAIERMNCSARSNTYGDLIGGDSTYYRVLVNDAPQTLPGCSDGPDESCSSSGLTDWLVERAAVFAGYSAACNTSSEYKNSTDQVTFYQNSDNGSFVGK
ncbi:hypothetical protein G647_03994 [Cladophialophora carrionii CBS 160.54]|uniref:Acid phosphatase n=1 Tax=Cladophialophora carrionii CBS 160.54 TaxID=1279043 RepID=V9DCP9_9EURO|nr:uncharacterized protein G647_03994 [Cladophialophora carrionii CBS 160.54]ETI24625.1 hypothetical protein G647_03994 [Cladophialophora carrionii CBS 160.54]